MNPSEFALAALCVLESSESNRERALSTLKHRSSEQTNPAAILWPSAGGIWESCSVHSMLNACCGKYCFWVYPTPTCCWDSLQSVDHLKKRDARSLFSSLRAVNLAIQHVLYKASSPMAAMCLQIDFFILLCTEKWMPDSGWCQFFTFSVALTGLPLVEDALRSFYYFIKMPLKRSNYKGKYLI